MSKLQDYKCRECGGVWTSDWVDSDDPMFRLIPCPFCYTVGIKKQFSVSVNRPMPEHYNMATGTVESSERSIREKLKVQSDIATERTGVEHRFVPVDMRDREALGVTDEGLDATNRRLRNEGKTEGKTYIPMDIPKVQWEAGHRHV